MVNQFKPGRGSALETTYLTHYAALVDSVAPILGSRFRAQDVVQDAWLKLAESPPDGDVRQPVAYLFRLVRNLAIDRSRRQALENRYGAKEEIPLSATSVEPSPEQSATTQGMLRDLSRVLEGLPEQTRRVFEMKRIHDYAVEDIAAELGVSQGYVYRLLREATVHCAKRLHKSWRPAD